VTEKGGNKMLDKLKGVMSVGSSVDELNKKIKETAASTKEQNAELSALKKELNEIKKNVISISNTAQSYAEQMNAELGSISELKEDMKKELYDLKLLKSTIQAKLVADLSETFRDELQKAMHRLDTDIKSYNEMRDKMNLINNQFSTLTSEMAKFKQIAEQVNVADFELAKYAREVTRMDKEKLDLMNKVDQLQTIISKERRSHSQRMH
jgi:septation ring formation regulator EzrA